MTRSLTPLQRTQLNQSTLLLSTNQLFMHYWSDDLICEDPNDQNWQNQVLFFWTAEEPFPRKSLPPEFATYKTRHFLFTGDTSNVSLKAGEAMPWFDMPGLGEKHFCEMNGQKITVPELNKLGIVDYVEKIELREDNLEILTDREHYYFLIDDSITPFQNGNFYLQGKPIAIEEAYSFGGIQIVKKLG